MTYIQTDECLALRNFFNGYSSTFTEISFNVVDAKTFVSQATQPASQGNFSTGPLKNAIIISIVYTNL